MTNELEKLFEELKDTEISYDNFGLGRESYAIIKQKLISQITQAIQRETEDRLAPYLSHEDDCILNRFEAGEPTENGGYRQKFEGKWYQAKPVDETPKCDCGLDSLIPQTK